MDNELTTIMDDPSAIFIFTKDRPGSLSKTLYSLTKINTKIYVIDDSFLLKNRLENYNLTSSNYNINYYGKNEYSNFLISNKMNESNSCFQIKELGIQEWNLGNARNFALVLAKLNGIENALFMDDDIIVNNATLISDSFRLLENYLFVGARISGMPDDSIIGHISSELEVEKDYERMLSGGFLAFNPKKVNIQFTNIYNEDWIWMFLQLNGNKFLEFGEVFQAKFDPFSNYESKILFQEFGEIVIDGIIQVQDNDYCNFLKDDLFWADIINERKKYLEKLIKISKQKKKKSFTEMVSWLEANLLNFDEFKFASYFTEYFVQSQKFMHFTNETVKIEHII